MDTSIGSGVSLYESNRRLLLLAQKLLDLPDERFRFDHWVGDKWEGRQDLSCGTTACSLGWATTIPDLRKVGLRLTRLNSRGVAHPRLKDMNKEYIDLSAGCMAFGLEYEEAQFLFQFGVDVNMRVTRKQAAARILRLVKKRQELERRLGDVEMYALRRGDQDNG